MSEVTDDRYEAEPSVKPGRRAAIAAANSVTLARLAAKALDSSRAYEQALKVHMRFPEEFEIGTVLKFKHVFPLSMAKVAAARRMGVEPEAVAYDYVAMRADNGFWYLTVSGVQRMAWQELVEFIGDEECAVVKKNGWKVIE